MRSYSDLSARSGTLSKPIRKVRAGTSLRATRLQTSVHRPSLIHAPGMTPETSVPYASTAASVSSRTADKISGSDSCRHGRDRQLFTVAT